MKKLIVLFLVAYQLVVKLYAQSVFYPTTGAFTRDKDEWYMDAVPLNDKELVLMGATSNKQFQFQELFLQKINLAGNVTLEMKLPLPSDSIYTFCNLFYRNGLLEAYGFAGKLKEAGNKTQYHKVVFKYVFDTSFNLLAKNTITLPIGLDFSIPYGRFKQNSQGNIYGGLQVLMEFNQVPDNPFGHFYFSLDSMSNAFAHYSFDTVQYYRNDLVGFEIQQTSASNYLSVKGVQNKDADIIEHHFGSFTSDFTKTPKYYSYSDTFMVHYSLSSPFGSLMESKDSTAFFMAGTGACYNDNYVMYKSFFLAELKIDSTLEFFPKDTIIRPRKFRLFNQSNYNFGIQISQIPSYFQCLDRNKKGEYVFAGMLNHKMEEYTLPGELVADTLIFTLINEDLTLKKQVSFFNNEQITLHKVMFLPDGSIIAFGFTRDYVKNPDNSTRDLFAIKLSSEGEPLTGIQVKNPLERKLLVYPNPTLNTLHVSCPFQPKYYQIMNVLGEKIAEGNPSSPNFMLDMSAYANGTFLLKVVGEHGEFGLEKVLH